MASIERHGFFDHYRQALFQTGFGQCIVAGVRGGNDRAVQMLLLQQGR